MFMGVVAEEEVSSEQAKASVAVNGQWEQEVILGVDVAYECVAMD